MAHNDAIPAPDPLGIVENATDGAVKDPLREAVMSGDVADPGEFLPGN